MSIASKVNLRLSRVTTGHQPLDSGSEGEAYNCHAFL